MNWRMKLTAGMAILVFALALSSNIARALTADEIASMNAKVMHSRNDEVKNAWKILKDNNVINVGDIKQWELANLYPRETHEEIADAIVFLQEAEVIEATPVNWAGTENACELLIEASEIYPRAIEMIDRAQRTIRFNIFLFGGKSRRTNRCSI